MRMLLVDDHVAFRTGFRALLEEIDDFHVVSEASSGEEAVSLAAMNAIDFVLMDMRMLGIGGLEATRRMLRKSPDLNVIILSACTHPAYPYHLLRAGAKGYLTKGCALNELVKAIRSVHSGEIYLDNALSETLALQAKRSTFYALSIKEMQIVLMLIDGKREALIAEKLYLSIATVADYRRQLFKKFGVKNLVGLIQLARKEGLLDQHHG